ncbi:MAG TPA: hypothetical protein GX510_06090, partial [Firmicutes bacterium]|nr:hypothetical protein [Candidatus Fermentithermobacillaceae bacterium]
MAEGKKLHPAVEGVAPETAVRGVTGGVTVLDVLEALDRITGGRVIKG